MAQVVVKRNEEEFLKTGLSLAEVQRRLKRYGYNELKQKRKKSFLLVFFSQFNDFMVYVLLGAAAVSYIVAEKADAVTIMIIVIINALLGFIQEFKTEKSLEALKELSAPNARVIRNGKTMTVKAKELVIGDLLLVEAGDRVAADAVLLDSEVLQSDESILTGESVSVHKHTMKFGKSEKEYTIYMGTTVCKGKGSARVIATGMSTEMGKIANLLQDIEGEKTPLQKRLESLGKYLVAGCLLICLLVTITGILRGENALEMFLIGVSLAVAAIPEGLPAIVTVSLALGVQRMMKQKALVRKLPAVETLGCTNVICSDKTGTLTENKMTVKRVYISDRIIELSDGEITNQKKNFFKEHRNNIAFKKLLEASVLCNTAEYELNIIGTRLKREKKEINISGDPTEVALLAMAAEMEIYKSQLRMKYSKVQERPFDSERKMMSILYEQNGKKYVFVKGALEKVLPRSKYVLVQNEQKVMAYEGRRKIESANASMARDALRVLAIAYKECNGNYNENSEEELVFLGLVGMIDPPRREVKTAIMECRLSGIVPVMITGDHKLTAEAVARELKIINRGENVITGEELNLLNDDELEKNIDKIRVFARVNPEHKHRIVKAFKKKGYVVAMTGDGVNDAPAVKEADIGVAMGENGTDVTKEAASMILLDDNFATIVAAVKEGRVIYDNIRKFIRYLLSCNIGEVLTMFLSSLLNLSIPLLPIQILLVNLATDGLPAMALSLEPPEDDVMERKPRRKEESIFSDGLWGKIILRGILIGVCTITSFAATMKYFDGNLKLARTTALCTLVFSQLFHVIECRSERKSIFKIIPFGNKYLLAAVVSSFVMILIVVYNPWFQIIFKTESLKIINWLIVVIFSTSISLLSNLFWHKK